LFVVVVLFVFDEVFVLVVFVTELLVLLLGVTLDELAELMFAFEEADRLEDDTEFCMSTGGVVDAPIVGGGGIVVTGPVGMDAAGIVVLFDVELGAN